MKHILLTIALFVSQLSLWAAEQTVTMVVSGQGKTKNEAQQNALRSAIEQAFGAFISSKTEILNDELVRDEVVSVSNGNIHGFEIVSSTEIPNGGGFAMTIKATVSVTKLTAYAEQKGAVVELKGSLFAASIRLQEMYEKNEAITVSNICESAVQMFAKSFDYALTVAEPTKSTTGEDKYDLLMTVDVKLNANYASAVYYFITSLSALSISKDVITEYKNLRKPLYMVNIADDSLLHRLTFRDSRSAETIFGIGNIIEKLTYGFVVQSNIFQLDSKNNIIEAVDQGRKPHPRPSGQWSLFEEKAFASKSVEKPMLWKIHGWRGLLTPCGAYPFNVAIYLRPQVGRYYLEFLDATGEPVQNDACYFPVRWDDYGDEDDCNNTYFFYLTNILGEKNISHTAIYMATLSELERITEITVRPKDL